jgi:hypothetical protein
MSEQATQSSLGSFRDTRTLDAKLTASRENWKPHSDPTQPVSVSGLVIDKTERELGFEQQGTAPFLRVLADDGTEWSVAGFHAVLRAELLRTGPHVGDRVGVIYQGEGKAKKDQSAPHLYRVVVERNPDGPQEPDRELPPAPDFNPDSDIPF